MGKHNRKDFEVAIKLAQNQITQTELIQHRNLTYSKSKYAASTPEIKYWVEKNTIGLNNRKYKIVSKKTLLHMPILKIYRHKSKKAG